MRAKIAEFPNIQRVHWPSLAQTTYTFQCCICMDTHKETVEGTVLQLPSYPQPQEGIAQQWTCFGDQWFCPKHTVVVMVDGKEHKLLNYVPMARR